MNLSLVILFHRPEALKKLLLSLKSAETTDGLEILIITNRVNGPEAEAIRKEFINLPIKLFLCETFNKSELRNIGVEKSESDIVYFIDDDVQVDKSFLKNISQKFQEHPEAAATGGPNLNPPDSSAFEKTIGALLASPVASSRMADRYRSAKERKTDDKSLMLCNLGFRKNILLKENLRFMPELEYNEENFLLKQLEKRGHRFLYTPEIVVTHHRRKNFISFLFQVFRSGRGRARSIKIDPANFGLIYILPSLLLIYIPSLFLFKKLPFAMPFVIYASFHLISGVSHMIKKRIPPMAAMAFPVLGFCAHLAYGAGFFYGIIMPLENKNK